MSFDHTLAKAGIAWSLASATARTERGTPYACKRMSMVLEDGTTVDHNFSLMSGVTLDTMLVNTLRKHRPHHPVLVEWRKSRGAGPVRFTKYALENLGECIHTAMRKAMDSKASVLFYNSVHHMDRKDWGALLKAVQAALVAYEAECKAAGKPMTRWGLGEVLERTVGATLETLRYEDRQALRNPTEKDRRREYLLVNMKVAAEITERDEWNWGWTSYLCEDLPAEETPAPEAANDPVAA